MEITESKLQEIINSGDAVIVDFWAPWCPTCMVMKPTFESVASKSSIHMYTMNVEDNEAFAIAEGIKSIPAVFVYKGGNRVYNKTGVHTEKQLNDLSNFFDNDKD